MRQPIAILLVLLAAAVAGPAAAGDRPGGQVVVEFGLPVPYGDLGDDYLDAPLGFGASGGLEAGFRWRLPLSNLLSLSPAFHFTDYGGVAGTDPLLGGYILDCSTYAYTLEARLGAAGPGTRLRPFLALGAGLLRNRAVGTDKETGRGFDDAINTFGASLRVGVALDQLEISVLYRLNRFSTWRFFRADQAQDYAWDALVLRGAWAIPFGEP